MEQSIIHVALVVREYDEAIAFFCGKLNFTLVEDTYQPEQDKRWVVVQPPGSKGTSLLLARAATPVQESFIGNHTASELPLIFKNPIGNMGSGKTKINLPCTLSMCPLDDRPIKSDSLHSLYQLKVATHYTHD